MNKKQIIYSTIIKKSFISFLSSSVFIILLNKLDNLPIDHIFTSRNIKFFLIIFCTKLIISLAEILYHLKKK